MIQCKTVILTQKEFILQLDNASGFALQKLIPFIFNMNTRLDDEKMLCWADGYSQKNRQENHDWILTIHFSIKNSRICGGWQLYTFWHQYFYFWCGRSLWKESVKEKQIQNHNWITVNTWIMLVEGFGGGNKVIKYECSRNYSTD